MSPFKIFFFILDGFLAVGSSRPDNVKAELYDFGTGGWTTVQDYPYGTYVAYYDMVYVPATSAYYVIGGYDGGSLSQIAKFKNGAWTEVGQLNTAREVSFSLFFCFKVTGSILRHIEPNGQMER